MKLLFLSALLLGSVLSENCEHDLSHPCEEDEIPVRRLGDGVGSTGGNIIRRLGEMDIYSKSAYCEGNGFVCGDSSRREPCTDSNSCSSWDNPLCFITTENHVTCGSGSTSCSGIQACSSTSDCPNGEICIVQSCCRDHHAVCTPSCDYNSGGGNGDPYYTSLSKNKFKYDGECQYSLLNNIQCNNNYIQKNINIPSFNILSKHGKCGGRTKNTVCIESLTFNVFNSIYEITKDNILKINGKIFEIPSYEALVSEDEIIIAKEKYIEKEKEYERIGFHTNFGLNLLFSNNGAGSVWIEATNVISKNSCGMLEETEENNGLLETSFIGDKWMVPYNNQPFICDLFPKTSFESSFNCNFNQTEVVSICDNMVSSNLKLMKGKDIESCFSNGEIDATRIYDNCIAEVCNCDKNRMSDCVPNKSINLWSNVCQASNVNFTPLEWKTLFY